MWDLIALTTQHGGMWVLKSGPKKGFSLRRKTQEKGLGFKKKKRSSFGFTH